jgi:aldehyde dehydrogenase (NAD+)
VRQAELNQRHNFVDGGFVAGTSAARLDLIDPTTEERFGSIVDSDAGDVDRAVRAARAALPGWAATTPAERGAILAAVADGYAARAEEIAALVARQNASPRWWNEQESVHGAAAVYRRAAARAAELVVERAYEIDGRRALGRYEPIGVVAAIVPWNSPQVLLGLKLAGALTAGCPVVAKPSPETSLDAMLLAEVMQQAGVPAGVLNIVTGGAATGAALVAHDGIDKVSFTGSTAAGRAIAAVCGQALRPVTAELGGKSATLILDDADLSDLAGYIQREGVPYSGQVCFSKTRVLVSRARAAEVTDLLVEIMSGLPYGDPGDPEVVLGPLVSARQRDRVEGYLRSASAEGATAVLGGGRAPGFDRGYYIAPTVLTGVTPEMRVFREEIFGPVLTVSVYQDVDDAVRLHNATEYGLGGAVFSTDLERANAVARRLAAGGILVNGYRGIPSSVVAHTAYKNSGLGARGVGNLDDYRVHKSISQPPGR